MQVSFSPPLRNLPLRFGHDQAVLPLVDTYAQLAQVAEIIKQRSERPVADTVFHVLPMLNKIVIEPNIKGGDLLQAAYEHTLQAPDHPIGMAEPSLNNHSAQVRQALVALEGAQLLKTSSKYKGHQPVVTGANPTGLQAIEFYKRLSVLA